ncbi:prolipoprotein diacylglyceryl transferase [Alkalihalobacterium elongatum]|uniref:prolipoprotein diacylglyceryl transferase n=1 Tax=Alkalihalobacterium elongatum TaxID=2675466 RepID=UPI001C1F7853|nr:prolipoprotein diacylglyceryl transferase [Alkalihalobacterium elongatum]
MEPYFSIGQIQLPTKWIFIGFSFMAAYIAMKFRLKNRNLNEKLLIDSPFNVVLIAWIVWKLSYILFHPVYAFTNPLGILYFNGGQRGIVLALIVGGIYLYYQSKKHRMSLTLYIDLLLTGFIAGSIIFYTYQDQHSNMFHAGQIGLALFLLVTIYISIKKLGDWQRLSTIILIYSLGQFFLQYFTNHLTVFLTFTFGQVIFFFIIILTLVFKRKGGETDR